MKLFVSPMSPYVRKVRAVAIETGLADRIEIVLCRVRDTKSGLREVNPLGRVPALVRGNGIALYDSPVICDYLDSLHDGPKLFPPSGEVRWLALRHQALGDGIMDAAVPTRDELLRPEAQRSQVWLEVYQGMITRALNSLEREVNTFSGVTIGTIAIACALGYLDFRFPEDRWREGRSGLANWFFKFSQRPSLAQTAPYQI